MNEEFPFTRMEGLLKEGLYDPAADCSTDQEIMAYLYPSMELYHHEDIMRSRRGRIYDLKNLDAIARVEGVDGIFIGPNDLAASLGHLGEHEHPEVLELIDDAIRRILAAGKAPGILTFNETLARHYIQMGCRFVAVGADTGLLADAARGLAAKYR